MLKILDEFRKTLDDLMLQAMHKRIVLYGYGYTGRFLKWYAEYYHSIKVDYVITLDATFGRPYDLELFQKSLFKFDYKDVREAVVWLAEPKDEEIKALLETAGYVEGRTYFDFYNAIYGQDVTWMPEETDAFKRRKTGKRDIQFLEWLEWKYDCNFVQKIERENLETEKVIEHGATYVTSTQKEIFPILDRCHCVPAVNDAIFDYGCGKGSAMISFLDYGFTHVGGGEYEPKIYDVLMDNMEKLKLKNNKNIECIQGDAADVNERLDKYNWFYMYKPFDDSIFFKVIDNICESIKRHNRKIHIIDILPRYHEYIESRGCFRLTNQFTIDTRQRVVNVYENCL